MNVRETLQQIAQGKPVGELEDSLKITIPSLNNNQLRQLAKLTTQQTVFVKRSGTGLTVIVKDKTEEMSGIHAFGDQCTHELYWEDFKTGDYIIGISPDVKHENYDVLKKLEPNEGVKWLAQFEEIEVAIAAVDLGLFN